VFGWCNGAFAEYASAAENNLLPKPANLTFEQSAAVGDSAFTALAAVRDQGKVRPGQRVLINGASGGVGTFAVQIAKSFGAHVTGVCGTRNVDMIRSIGADQVIDYTKEDFTQSAERYDAMLDLVGSRSLSDCRRALTPRGTYVVVGVKDMGRWFGLGRQFKALSLSPFVGQRMRVFVVRHNKEDLAVLKELVEAGKVAPVIDRHYALRDVPRSPPLPGRRTRPRKDRHRRVRHEAPPRAHWLRPAPTSFDTSCQRDLRGCVSAHTVGGQSSPVATLGGQAAASFDIWMPTDGRKSALPLSPRGTEQRSRGSPAWRGTQGAAPVPRA
jgi:hypothetical protein